MIDADKDAEKSNRIGVDSISNKTISGDSSFDKNSIEDSSSIKNYRKCGLDNLNAMKKIN